MDHAKCYIPGYPRPQFVRKEWADLNGKWAFAFDEEDAGEANGYANGFEKQYDILVPFSYECAKSCVGREEMCPNVWYARSFSVGREQRGRRILLHFEGVDHLAKVWVNGAFAGSHCGGYARFTLDITAFVKEGENRLVVKAEDGFDLAQPRGKQRWEPYNYGCWYVQTTGIWKPVWLEFVSPVASMRSVKITPDIADYSFGFEFDVQNGAGCELEIAVELRGKPVARQSAVLQGDTYRTAVGLNSPAVDNQILFWNPCDPAIYDLTFTLKKGGKVIDTAASYAALRDFRAEGASLKLNSVPYYQKLVLYQGYWADTSLTIPDEESVVRDIESIREMGYNGIRIHQMIEDERFLYYADIMGLLVWCEMPSPHEFSERANAYFLAEWMEIVRQMYNHPSVITWVVYNESWGIREVACNRSQQAFTEAMYKLTKAYDRMRPVISNDGWEHTLSDVLTIHNYEQDADILAAFYRDLPAVLENRVPALPQRNPYAEGYSYGGQPVIFSEFGGCAFSDDVKDGWGYGTAVDGQAGFLQRFEKQVRAVKSLPYCAGYCYTQFTDVQQEKNGLLTIDRKYKADPEKIRRVNDSL